MIIDVDREKIESFGPHNSGGSFVIVNGHHFHVKEKVNQILNDGSSTRTT